MATLDSPKFELKHVEFDDSALQSVCPIAQIQEISVEISADSNCSDANTPRLKRTKRRRRGSRTRPKKNKSESNCDQNSQGEHSSSVKETPRLSNRESFKHSNFSTKEKDPPLAKQRHDSTRSTVSNQVPNTTRNVKPDDSDSDSTTDSSSSCASSFKNGSKSRGLAGKGGTYISGHRAVNAGKTFCGCILRERVYYMVKPLTLIFCGAMLISGGVTLTTFHFIYEDSVATNMTGNLPYFTYGPITLSTGLIIFMIGLVWFPIKQKKWKDGTASPIIAALARARLARGDIEIGGIALTLGQTVNKDDKSNSKASLSSLS